MDINIKTTLGINPRRKPKELLAITRGASFLLTYKLDISYDIVSQVTFTFKQKQKLFYYNMFHYLTSMSDTEIEEGKILDEHFKYEKETNSVLFMFSPVETAKFSPTTPGAEIKFEVAVRANTDNRDDLVSKDAVYIDRQPSIIVKDSLYGQVLSDTNTVADNQEWLASPRRTVKVSSGTLTIGNTTITEEQLQKLLASLQG